MERATIEKFDAARQSILLAVEQIQQAQKEMREAGMISEINCDWGQRILRINIARLYELSDSIFKWTL